MDGRRVHRKELTAQVVPTTVNFTKAEMVDRLGGKVPLGPLYDMADISADEHSAVRYACQSRIFRIGQKLRIAGVQIKMSDTPGAVRHRAPMHGGHGNAILPDHGFRRTNSPDTSARVRSNTRDPRSRPASALARVSDS
jgi:crotonobetainyl-CoA:carnitine CoA-transferase CaiB-like acyl-CoA transferase